MRFFFCKIKKNKVKKGHKHDNHKNGSTMGKTPIFGCSIIVVCIKISSKVQKIGLVARRNRRKIFLRFLLPYQAFFLQKMFRQFFRFLIFFSSGDFIPLAAFFIYHKQQIWSSTEPRSGAMHT